MTASGTSLALLVSNCFFLGWAGMAAMAPNRNPRELVGDSRAGPPFVFARFIPT
jgi:hypothetical protein